MAQVPIEMILLRQWASYIAIPMWIIDVEGNLLFFNEAAEAIVGRRFDEFDDVNVVELAGLFSMTDLDGRPLEPQELTMAQALAQRVPAHRKMRVRSLDGKSFPIEVTSLPIEGQGGRLLGGVAAFWEIPEQ